MAELGTELCFSHEAILLTASRNKVLIFIVTFFKIFLNDFEVRTEFRDRCPFLLTVVMILSAGLLSGPVSQQAGTAVPKDQEREPGIGMSSSQKGKGGRSCLC